MNVSGEAQRLGQVHHAHPAEVLAGKEAAFRAKEEWEREEARRRDDMERAERRIEQELQYPGQIKVVVIRETRAVDFAR